MQIKKYIIKITPALYLASAKLALAQTTPTTDRFGLKETQGKAGLPEGTLPSLVGTIINRGLLLIGALLFGLLLYGGIVWMKARGNEKEVEKAKDVITSAIIGIIIVAAAYAITSFILDVVTK